MDFNAVVLACSKKYNNYCVACYDLNKKKLIRLISDDDSIKNALTDSDIQTKNNGPIKIGDVIRVLNSKSHGKYEHPEDVIIDRDKRFEKIKGVKYNWDDFLTAYDYVFFDTHRKIQHDEIKEKKNIHSLEFIQVTEPSILYSEEYDNIKICFKYRGREYDNISLTDIEFKNKLVNYCSTKGINVVKCRRKYYFLISLGEIFERDNCHYKLISGVVRI